MLEKANADDSQRRTYFKGAVEILRVLGPGWFQEVVIRENYRVWGAPGCPWLLEMSVEKQNLHDGQKSREDGPLLLWWVTLCHITENVFPFCPGLCVIGISCPHQLWTLTPSQCCVLLLNNSSSPIWQHFFSDQLLNQLINLFHFGLDFWQFPHLNLDCPTTAKIPCPHRLKGVLLSIHRESPMLAQTQV